MCSGSKKGSDFADANMIRYLIQNCSIPCQDTLFKIVPFLAKKEGLCWIWPFCGEGLIAKWNNWITYTSYTPQKQTIMQSCRWKKTILKKLIFLDFMFYLLGAASTFTMLSKRLWDSCDRHAKASGRDRFRIKMCKGCVDVTDVCLNRNLFYPVFQPVPDSPSSSSIWSSCPETTKPNRETRVQSCGWTQHVETIACSCASN